MPIYDAAAKATGGLRYAADMRLPRMLHAKVLLSPVAHARIASIDVSRALSLPGVRAVVTHENTPDIRYNSATRFYEHEIPATERVFDDTVRFVGDRVAAVAADTKQIAEQAARLIKVEYEPLPVLLDVEEAMKEEAYPIHGSSNVVARIELQGGDVARGFKDAELIFEGRYATPPVHHGAIEPHAVIASFDAMGKLTVFAPCQNTFAFRILYAKIFGLPFSKVRVVSPAIGGAFGGKLEMTLEPVAVALAKATGRPVKLEYDRRETVAATRVRHGSVTYMKTGVNRDGTIVAQEMTVITNTGAYAGSALNVIGAMSHKVFKMYKFKNMRFVGIPVYTNTPIGGAMRGYGSPQAYFAQQCHMQKIADGLGISMEDFQRKNLVEPHDLDQTGRFPIGNPRPRDCLERALELARNWEPLSDEDGRYKIGVGLAMGAHGNGCFGAHRDQTIIIIKMNEDGTCLLYTGTHDMGNGSVTLQKQIVSAELSVPVEHVDVIAADSDATAWNLGDYASRGAYVSGAAVRKVALQVKERILEEAAALLKEDVQNLSLEAGKVASAATGASARLDEIMVHAQNVSHKDIICAGTHASGAGPISYGAHVARVRVDAATGDVKLTDYAAVHDVGHALNRMSLEGQLHGGIQMAAGYALTEGLVFDELGRNKYPNFRAGRMLAAPDMPRIQVDFIEECEPSGPYGAKSIGECAVVPGAPAVINAIHNATGQDIRAIPYREFRAQNSAPR